MRSDAQLLWAQERGEGCLKSGNIRETHGDAGVGEAIAGTTLRDVVSDKIAADMQKETDFARIRDQIDCREHGIRIMGLLG